MALEDIDTIIFVMLENRSFDQMLGYLSLDDTNVRLPVDGLRSDANWQAQFSNAVRDTHFPLRKISAAQSIHQDPPHGHESIAQQIETPPAGPGATKMGGFVASYLDAHKRVDDPGVVMGYYGPDDVPSYDFLARNFCVCDHWFTSLPLGTQANRLMAMAGESRVLDNVIGLPDQQLVYDWLDNRGIGWKTYISGGYAPFFIMMRRWTLKIVGSLAMGNGPFRRFSAFKKEWQSKNNPAPSVIFIEPEYADAPMSDPNDDHPPARIAKGQEFVRQIYEVVTSNEARWQRTLMIITYDEHGGFFDHVPPPPLKTMVNGVTLETMGPRVPAILVSPHVGSGQVFSEPLDHTSLLQLIADRFGDGNYSPAVTARQAALGRIENALQPVARAGKPPAMPRPLVPAGPKLRALPTAPNTPNAAAIDAIMREYADKHPQLIDQPGWSEMKLYLESNAPPQPLHSDNLGEESEL